MFDEDEIPEIWETVEERSLSIGQLKYRYLQVAREKFQGNVYTNKYAKKPQSGNMTPWIVLAYTAFLATAYFQCYGKVLKCQDYVLTVSVFCRDAEPTMQT